MRFCSKSILTLLLVWIVNFPARATHLVGGEITYTCLGSDGSGSLIYSIQITIYQDCLTGLQSARQEDDPAFLGIFTPSGLPIIPWDSIRATEDIAVPPNFSNECVNNPPATCLRRVSFKKQYLLPPSSTGYRVMYVRCCRNASILNLNNPSQVGATYYCDIPPSGVAFTNNSAVFKNYPPQIICINNPLVYDHGAYDPDGDSLSYEFCDAYPGGVYNDPKPRPYSKLPAPLTVPSLNPPSYGYVTGFSPAKPMAGNPLIQIDPRTGLITGTPNLMGRYVVSVCCHEWRNGIMINTVHREFQFVVTNCSKAVVANIPQLSNEFNTYIVDCKGYNVSFINQSTGGFNYTWNFGVPGATSTDFQPNYTYPDTGTYVVKLIVNKGSTCPDSISRFVKIYPSHKADFEYAGLLCPKMPIQFTDKSDATYKPIVAWHWNFGDGTESDLQNPIHSFSQGSNYGVTLISTTIKGCVDTINKAVKVAWFVPFAGNDTIIVKGETINFNASGGIEYTWTPGDKLNITNINNPKGYYPDTGRYAYNVHIKSVDQCEGDDSIKVWVVAQASVFIPSAFSPNGDGLNDYLKMLSVGYAKINFFRIFNRWGQVVFQTDHIGDGWDGKYKGKDTELGTYFWVLSVTDRYGKDELLKGDVTLLR
ncbi:MAG: gliding motility-associated C-terminal domain-containing protein [Bacteroidetes bacterium]|nr:gliding motility-associated C-terminal domain-containing protein [Bacteroidota bacterium]